MHSAGIIILYYAIRGSTKVKNTKDKYTIKTYKNIILITLFIQYTGDLFSDHRFRHNYTSITNNKPKNKYQHNVVKSLKSYNENLMMLYSSLQCGKP